MGLPIPDLNFNCDANSELQVLGVSFVSLLRNAWLFSISKNEIGIKEHFAAIAIMPKW